VPGELLAMPTCPQAGVWITAPTTTEQVNTHMPPTAAAANAENRLTSLVAAASSGSGEPGPSGRFTQLVEQKRQVHDP